MKSKLTEWISKAVQEMNLSRKEKIIKCYADTGILDAWSPQKNDLYEEAVEKRHSLFPNMRLIKVDCQMTQVISRK